MSSRIVEKLDDIEDRVIPFTPLSTRITSRIKREAEVSDLRAGPSSAGPLLLGDVDILTSPISSLPPSTRAKIATASDMASFSSSAQPGVYAPNQLPNPPVQMAEDDDEVPMNPPGLTRRQANRIFRIKSSEGRSLVNKGRYDDKCWKCGWAGHYAKHCTKRDGSFFSPVVAPSSFFSRASDPVLRQPAINVTIKPAITAPAYSTSSRFIGPRRPKPRYHTYSRFVGPQHKSFRSYRNPYAR